MKNDVLDILDEKGFVVDEKQLELVMKKCRDSLIDKGYWEILNAAVDECGLKKPEFSLDEVKVGSVYTIRSNVHIKKQLHKKKIEIVEVNKEDLFHPIVGKILDGRLVGLEIDLGANDLESVK